MSTSRRTFLRTSLSVASTWALGACGATAEGAAAAPRGDGGAGGAPGAAGGDGGDGGAGGAAGASAGGGLGDAGAQGGATAGAPGQADAGAATDAGERCLVTRPDIEGPFFTADSPERRSLLEPELRGTRLTVTGRVLDGGCRPIAGAIVDVWQADVDGAYDNAGDRLRGHQRTDAEGRYHLTTIIPGRYLNGAQYRPAHIHVKVAGPGKALLTTQLYFDGDPFNEVDPWFDEATMLRPTAEGAAQAANFDFVLP